MFATHLHRRRFLRNVGLASLPLFIPPSLLAADPGDLIVREKDPANLEFRFDTLDSFLTPTERFYVRSHFAVPAIKSKDWRLQVVGAVEKPLTLTYEELTALPAATLPATLECAGNGRAFLDPKTKGVQWETGAVSTAEWTGVTLAALLDRAKVKPGAVEVILEGTDRGEPKNEPKPHGAIPFARSLSLAKARKSEVVLAYKMNGAALPPAHGFPVRAVVGGWYGMASVKWLSRIVVTDRPFEGYWQTTGYAIWQKRDGLASLTPITELQVKSTIARPRAGETVPAGKDVRIHGAAWAGEAEVAKVEVSSDGDKTWSAATLLGKAKPWCWRLWEFTWKAPAAGKYVLMSRATDTGGQAQPLERDPDRRNYVINHCLPVKVTVR